MAQPDPQRQPWMDDVLDLATQEATGRFLILSPNGDRNWLWIRDGQLTGVSAPVRRPLLARRVVAFQLLGTRMVAKALESARSRPGTRLMDVLMAEELVPADFLEEYLRSTMCEQMAGLQQGGVREVVFEPGRTQRISPMLLDVAEVFAGALATTPRFPADITGMALAAHPGVRASSPIEESFLAASDGHRRPAGVADHLGLTIDETMRLIERMEELGAVAMVDPRALLIQGDDTTLPPMTTHQSAPTGQTAPIEPPPNRFRVPGPSTRGMGSPLARPPMRARPGGPAGPGAGAPAPGATPSTAQPAPPAARQEPQPMAPPQAYAAPPAMPAAPIPMSGTSTPTHRPPVPPAPAATPAATVPVARQAAPAAPAGEAVPAPQTQPSPEPQGMTARTDPTPLADVPGGSAADAQKASADDDAHTRAPVEEQPEAAETAAKTKKAKKPGKAQKAAEKAQRAEGKADTGEQPEAGKHEDAEAQPERPDRSAPTDREEPQDQPRPGEHGGTIEPGPVPQLAPPSVEAHYDPPPWRVMPPPVVPAQAARLSGPQAPEPQQPAPGPSAETHVPAVAAPPPRPPHVPRRPATPGELDRIAAQLAPTMPPGADQPPDDDVPVHRIPAARPAAHRDAMSLLSSLYDVGEPEAPARPTPPAPPPRPARGEPVWQAVVAPEGEAMDRTDVLSQLHFLGDESPSGSEPESDSESQAKGPGSAKPKRRGFFGR